MCAAIYVKKYMKVPDKLAFISPCIAKKMEIQDPENLGLVQYNETFEHLMKYVRENKISGTPIHSDIEYGLGSFYPTPGGLMENVKWFLGNDVFIRQIEGERHLYEWMHTNADRIRRNTRHYAKRQLTWFRRYDTMEWLNISDYPSEEAALEVLIRWLKEKL